MILMLVKAQYSSHKCIIITVYTTTSDSMIQIQQNDKGESEQGSQICVQMLP